MTLVDDKIREITKINETFKSSNTCQSILTVCKNSSTVQLKYKHELTLSNLTLPHTLNCYKNKCSKTADLNPSGTLDQGIYDDCYQPSGREPEYKYDMKSVVNSRSGRSLQKIGKPLGPIRKLNELRTASEVKCDLKQKGKPCNALKKVNIYSKFKVK